MKKVERQRLIQQILQERDIHTQEDLVLALHEAGINVAQATISRDMKELKLMKVPSTKGDYRYSMPIEKEIDLSVKVDKFLKEAVLSVSQMEKFVILHTIPGNATAASKLIEKQYKNALFAALNDDDSVLMITKTAQSASALKNELAKYL